MTQQLTGDSHQLGRPISGKGKMVALLPSLHTALYVPVENIVDTATYLESVASSPHEHTNQPTFSGKLSAPTRPPNTASSAPLDSIVDPGIQLGTHDKTELNIQPSSVGSPQHASFSSIISGQGQIYQWPTHLCQKHDTHMSVVPVISS